MRACVQRVSSASVTVDQEVVGRIDRGLVVLLGVGQADTQEDARQLADKITSLRIFEDEAGKMNRSIIEASGSMLVVSQFTLFGDCRKGRRPSFTQAAPPEVADALYQAFVASVGAQGVRVETGVFRAHMDVALVNDGPVTMLLDTTRLF
ncbi:MAG: D-tyrosyl-tRNA(Tyr) deacylase [Planctomycetales bacterium]|nr:D-tyrosyl-tRNA(Tyr) deacylase [Planctomycetales bacterium]